MSYSILDDWMTTPEHPFNSKITEYGDDIVHCHKFYEIFYVLEGSITHVLNGEARVLHAGDMVFLNLEDIHSFIREEGNTCKHRDIIIYTEFFDSVCTFLGDNFKEAYQSNHLPKVLTLTLDQMEAYEHRITNAILTSGMNSEYRLSSTRALCVSLLNLLVEERIRHNDSYYPMWFRELLGRFHMNEFLKMGLDDILKPFHFNKSYLCRRFRQYTGYTMTEYLNRIRLQQAAFQLQYTDNTILSVCDNVGFSSISYFNKLFKQTYGMTPKTFRKNRNKKVPHL
jgi:AraC family cel operon transcriptional repressor